MLSIKVSVFIKKFAANTFRNELQRKVYTHTGWDGSYEAVSVMLLKIIDTNPDFKNVDLLFEYKVPNKGYCDLVIVGQKDGKPGIFIIELKHWEEGRRCVPFRNQKGAKQKGKIIYNGGVVSHPSQQTLDYVQGCRDNHTAFVNAENCKPEVAGAVFFTNRVSEEFLESYRSSPNKKLTEEIPVYSNKDDGDVALVQAISEFITGPDEKFLEKFVQGKYTQSFDLKVRTEQALRRIMNDGDFDKPFDLRGSQTAAYDKIKKALNSIFENGTDSSEKRVFIVKGMPGSGKTAVAANLLIDALAMQMEKVKSEGMTSRKLSELLKGSILFTSSSTNQTTWKNTFSGCKSLLVGQECFNPGFSSGNKTDLAEKFQQCKTALTLDDNTTVTPAGLTEMRKNVAGTEEEQAEKPEVPFFKPEKWRAVWKVIKSRRIEGVPCDIDENMYTLTIADEAHSLPKTYDEDNKREIKFTSKPGWPEGIGPEAFYIMYTSRISVFLMEDEQGFQDYEATTIADIKNWAHEDLGIPKGNIVEFELTEQYRCGESQEYIDWVNDLFYHPEKTGGETGADSRNFKDKSGKETFSLEITGYPSEMEEIVRAHMKGHHETGRLISSYSVFWKSNSTIFGTKDISSQKKQQLPPERKDFYLPDKDGKYWSRVWNTPGEFVAPVTNLETLNDPLCEVGYPQEIRGWDFAYFGILWLDDLLWREEKWALRCKRENNKTTFRGSIPTQDKLEEKYPDKNDLIDYLLNRQWYGPIWDRGISSIRGNAEDEIKNVKGLVKTGADGTDYVLQPDVDNTEYPQLRKLFFTMFRIYRILLTRALKGNVIYVKDPETREHLRELLK